MNIGTATRKAGEITRGVFTVAEAPDGPIHTDVYIAAGAEDGPVLWVQSLIHGDEIGGYLGLSQFLRQLHLPTMQGTVIAFPAVNPAAYRAWSRTIPQDGENLNRMFPGNARGTHSQQIAHTLLETALEHADVVVDLHSGGATAQVPLYALYWENGSAASAESHRLARAAGTGVVWKSNDDWLVGGMFRHVVEAGKAAVIIECGGGTSVSGTDIAAFAGTLHGMAHAMGMEDDTFAPAVPETHVVLGASELVFNTRAGVFHTAHEAGAVLQPREVIGEMRDFLGHTLERIIAPNHPVYLAALRNNHFPLHNGELICEAMEIVS